MATGYTADVQSGKVTEFSVFASRCARAMGALILMRDDAMDAPIPDEFKPSDWNEKALAKAKAEVKEVKSMTPAMCEAAAEADYQQMTNARAAAADEMEYQRRRYSAMLQKVQVWKPPSKDHEGFKKFMIEQLQTSIEHDCERNHWPEPKRLTGTEWRIDRVGRLLKDIEYHTKAHAEEVERTNGRNMWIRQLRESLSTLSPEPRPMHNHKPLTQSELDAVKLPEGFWRSFAGKTHMGVTAGDAELIARHALALSARAATPGSGRIVGFGIHVEGSKNPDVPIAVFEYMDQADRWGHDNYKGRYELRPFRPTAPTPAAPGPTVEEPVTMNAMKGQLHALAVQMDAHSAKIGKLESLQCDRTARNVDEWIERICKSIDDLWQADKRKAMLLAGVNEMLDNITRHPALFIPPLESPRAVPPEPSPYVPGGPKFGKVCDHGELERSCDECSVTTGEASDAGKVDGPHCPRCKKPVDNVIHFCAECINKPTPPPTPGEDILTAARRMCDCVSIVVKNGGRCSLGGEQNGNREHLEMRLDALRRALIDTNRARSDAVKLPSVESIMYIIDDHVPQGNRVRGCSRTKDAATAILALIEKGGGK